MFCVLCLPVQAAAARKVEVVGHRIIAARAQRLAAYDAPSGQQATPPRTEAGHRDTCIIGATGVKAATLSQQRADEALVKVQQEEDQSTHGIHVAETACGARWCKYSRRMVAGVKGIGL